MSKRTRTEKGKALAKPTSSTPKPKKLFINETAENRFIHLSKRNINSGRFVVIQDFEHLDIPRILHNNSLDEFLTIREQVYTPLVPYFYTNFSFDGNRISTRVLGRDINISISQFADILHLPTGGADVYTFDLLDFEFPEGESSLTASTLIHGDDNPSLVRNEVVSRYTLTSQILAKIIFFNIVPKSGEYSHARGPVPLIIYCLLRGIRINFPRLIASHMASDQIRLSGRTLPYGMVITHILKALDFDLSSIDSDEPTVDIDGSLLKRMEAQLRRHALEQPPAPPAVPGSSAPGSSSAPGTSSASAPVLPSISSEVRSQFEAHQSWIEQREAAFRAEMDARFQQEAAFRTEMDARFQQEAASREETNSQIRGIRNDMSYFADSMRFMDTQFEALFTKFDMFPPDPTTIARPIPSTGPPFPTRAPSSVPPPRPKVLGVDPEEVAPSSSSSSSSEEDDDGDKKMDAKKSSSSSEYEEEEEDDEDDDAAQ